MRVCSVVDPTGDRVPMRTSRVAGLAMVALALALLVPLSTPRAESADCGSLDISIEPSAGFSEFTCDSGSFAGGGPSRTEEGIVANGVGSVFIVRHAVAGVRTYFSRMDTRALVDDGSVFGKTENWISAPGGNQFIVSRFKGWLPKRPDRPLACFAFSRFTGHVDRSSGFRHIVFGFYCTETADQVSDAEVRRLIDAVKLGFE
jgi:hypothetical protein